MSRRNFILLIIVLFILLVGFLMVLYSNRTPRAPGEDGGFLSSLNPFGRGSNAPGYGTPAYNTPNPDGTVSGEESALKLTKVSTIPVAGYSVFQKERTEKEFFPAVRYASKETGNIYQTFADEIKEKKFSSTLIPKIEEAFFANGGDSVILRYLKNDTITIETYLGVLPKEELGSDTTGSYEMKGSFLADNINEVAVSSDGTRLFYLLNSSSGVSGITLTFKDGKRAQLFQSDFTEWLPVWNAANTISLTTKPSGTVLGYMYNLGTDKRFSKVIGGINGLTTLASPSGNSVLYTDSNLSLSLYDIRTGDGKGVGLRTEPEKCVWAKDSITLYCAVPKFVPSGTYPDSWYQGEVSFSDQIWKVNTLTGVTTLLLDPGLAVGGEEIDGIKLQIDASETYLFFVNKKDSFLWKVDLK